MYWHHHWWVTVASLPSLSVRDAVRPTFRDLNMSPAVSPGNHDLNFKKKLASGDNLGLVLWLEVELARFFTYKS